MNHRGWVTALAWCVAAGCSSPAAAPVLPPGAATTSPATGVTVSPDVAAQDTQARVTPAPVQTADGPPQAIASTPTVVWHAPSAGLSTFSSSEQYLVLASDLPGDLIAGVAGEAAEGSVIVRLDPATGNVVWSAQVPEYYQGALVVQSNMIAFVAPSQIDGAPAVATGFDADGVQKWTTTMPFSSYYISGGRDPRTPDRRPSSSGGQGLLVNVDSRQVPGWIVVDAQQQLVGIDIATGATWTYPVPATVTRITGPENGDAGEYLHLVDGADVTVIDGTNGTEVKRSRIAPTGFDLGPHSGLPTFDDTSFYAEATAAGSPGVLYLDAGAKGVVYAVVLGQGQASASVDTGPPVSPTPDELVAIDVGSGQVLWRWPGGRISQYASASAIGELLVTTDDGTVLLRG